MSGTTLADLVTSFFTSHLAAERNASPHTIASYRDTFRLLLRHVADTNARAVRRLSIDDFAPQTILSFLEHLERDRGNSISTRNARLAAIRSFFSYAVTRDVSVASVADRIIAIPFKKGTRQVVGYLSEAELRAILASPERSTAQGRRDYLALSLLYDTAGRVQEVINLRPIDFRLDRSPLVYVVGKGRKERVVPLLPATAGLVRQHLEETERTQDDDSPLVRNYRNSPMTRSGMTYLLDKHRRRAAHSVPSLRRDGISPHIMRHTKAMHLLQAGVSLVTIKDILGHADLRTLSIYVEADLDMKRKALETAGSPVDAPSPTRSDPDLLQWLEQL